MTTWRALLVLLVVDLAAGAWSLAVDGPTPSWTVYPVLLVVGLALLRRRPRAAAAWVAGLSALFALVHVPFVRAALADRCVHPADPALDCHPVTWLVTLGAVPAATALAAAVLWWRERQGSPLPV